MTREDLLRAVEAARASGKLGTTAIANLAKWASEEGFASQWDAIGSLLAARDYDEIADAFGAVIPFGTGGRRGAMGPGPNRINERTIGESAQGLSRYLLASREAGATAGAALSAPSVVIAYDTRHNSRHFAQYAASIVAGNGIKALLFDGPRSTPELSFAVRRLEANAGIVISASHNPPSDNGFKAYWSDGGQVVPPHDRAIIEGVSRATELVRLDLGQAARKGLYAEIGREVDTAYIEYCAGLALEGACAVRIVYTPLHGTGTSSVAPALAAAGFHDVFNVESQWGPDPDFSGVTDRSPNPENPPALDAALRHAQAIGADLVLASDPDADRLGAAVKHGGTWQFLTGNRIGVLIFDHVVRSLAATGRIPRGAVLLKTCVTSDLFDRIAETHGVAVQGDYLVGFKYIAEAIGKMADPSHFVFGTEESHGYLRGPAVRDKDAAQAAVLLAELAALLKTEGKTLIDALGRIWARYGYHAELTRSIALKGTGGAGLAKTMMDSLRSAPPAEIAGEPVIAVVDRRTGKITDPRSGRETGASSEIAGDLLVFHMKPGGTERISIRPSGTEPKVKVYVQIHGAGSGEPGAIRAATDARAERLAAALARLAEIGA